MVEPEENYRPIIDLINKTCIVAEFDKRSSAKYSQILNKNFPELKKIAQEESVSREKMKVVHLILACALVRGAKSIYTHDERLTNFAQGLINVRRLSTNPTQNKLF